MSAVVVSSYERLHCLCREAVVKVRASFDELGDALRQMRTSRAYQEKYKTFEEYCEREFNISRGRAHQLCRGAEFVNRMIEAGKPKPHAESAIRPITALPAGEQAEAYQEAGEAEARSRGKEGWMQPSGKTATAVVQRRKSPNSGMGFEKQQTRVPREDEFYEEDAVDTSAGDGERALCPTCHGEGYVDG